MEAEEFRKRGKEMMDYIADYLETIATRQPMPDVKPGYMKELVRDEAPRDPDSWEDLMKDIEPIIMKGTTHWHNPHFHAYFPTANSYPSILGDMLCGGIGSVGFTWASNPSCTELEVTMMNWLGKMLKLPPEFLFSSDGHGGGVILSNASEATLCGLLAARTQAIRRIKGDNPSMDDHTIMSKLVCYCSDQAHSSVIKAGLIGAVDMRILESDNDGSLRGSTLEKAVKEDLSKGRTPFFVCATLGSTGCCAFDNIKEMGPVCKREGIWMHIDAAYAGSAFICPEFRSYLDGVEDAMSFNFNPHKWLQIHFDCSALWVKDSRLLSEAFIVDSLCLKNENENSMPDYSDVNLAREFEKLVRADNRFEITSEVRMALVCFRLKGTNEINEQLFKLLNEDRRIHLVASVMKGRFYIRFVVCASSTTNEDVIFAWKVIQEITDEMLRNCCFD